MTEEEQNKMEKDILFQIDMQLYEFNERLCEMKKLCEMNDNLGTIYTYKDIMDLEKAEKEKERKLLREAVRELQKENEELKETLKCTQDSWFNDTQKLDKLQKELDKKDKVIGLMANQLSIASDRYEYMEETEIIEYFYKKVEKENE